MAFPCHKVRFSLGFLIMEDEREAKSSINLTELQEAKEKDTKVLMNQFVGLKTREREVDLFNDCKNPKARGAYCVIGKPMTVKKVNQMVFCKVMRMYGAGGKVY